MGPVRAVLFPGGLLLLNWNEALYHVSQAKDVIIHSSTSRQPFKHLFQRGGTNSKPVCSSGCAIYALRKKELSKLDNHLENGIRAKHVPDGLYRILVGSGIIITKHAQLDGTSFPAIRSNTLVSKADYVVCEDVSIEHEVESTELVMGPSNDNSDVLLNDSVSEPLTGIPPHLSNLDGEIYSDAF